MRPKALPFPDPGDNADDLEASAYSRSYCDIEDRQLDRGLQVDHTESRSASNVASLTEAGPNTSVDANNLEPVRSAML